MITHDILPLAVHRVVQDATLGLFDLFHGVVGGGSRVFSPVLLFLVPVPGGDGVPRRRDPQFGGPVRELAGGAILAVSIRIVLA